MCLTYIRLPLKSITWFLYFLGLDIQASKVRGDFVFLALLASSAQISRSLRPGVRCLILGRASASKAPMLWYINKLLCKPFFKTWTLVVISEIVRWIKNILMISFIREMSGPKRCSRPELCFVSLWKRCFKTEPHWKMTTCTTTQFQSKHCPDTASVCSGLCERPF